MHNTRPTTKNTEVAISISTFKVPMSPPTGGDESETLKGSALLRPQAPTGKVKQRTSGRPKNMSKQFASLQQSQNVSQAVGGEGPPPQPVLLPAQAVRRGRRERGKCMLTRCESVGFRQGSGIAWSVISGDAGPFNSYRDDDTALGRLRTGGK